MRAKVFPLGLLVRSLASFESILNSSRRFPDNPIIDPPQVGLPPHCAPKAIPRFRRSRTTPSDQPGSDQCSNGTVTFIWIQFRFPFLILPPAGPFPVHQQESRLSSFFFKSRFTFNGGGLFEFQESCERPAPFRLLIPSAEAPCSSWPQPAFAPNILRFLLFPLQCPSHCPTSHLFSKLPPHPSR